LLLIAKPADRLDTYSAERTPKALKSTHITAVTLWVASIVTIVMMLFYVVKLITG